MPRFSILQSVTVLFLFGSCMYVANLVSTYLLKENGGYSQWSVFSACSKSCDGGIRMRKRSCNNPVPRYGGNNCSVLGHPVQVFACNRQPCPINGAYGAWGKFGKCSEPCGGGVQEKFRKCDSPAPQHGGKNCKEMELGPDSETRACNKHICPVHGGYSIWSDFSECTKSCGGGVKTRARTCTNPAPANGGNDCEKLGPSSETESCNDEPCMTTLPPTEPTTSPSNTELLTTPVIFKENETQSTMEPKYNVTEKPKAEVEITDEKTEKPTITINNEATNKPEANTTTTEQPPTDIVKTESVIEASTDSPTTSAAETTHVNEHQPTTKSSST